MANAAIFSYFIWDYFQYEQSGLLRNFFLYAIGDRFTVFLISGISLVIMFSMVIRGIIYKDYVKLRLGSHCKSCMVMAMAVIFISFVMLSVQFVMVGLISLCAGIKEGMTGASLSVSLKVYINTLLYYITVGMLVMASNMFFRNKTVANMIPVCLLVFNSILGNNLVRVGFIYKLTFSGHIYILSLSVDAIFWLSICAVLYITCLIYPYLKLKKIMNIGRNGMEIIRFVLCTVGIFIIYGTVSSIYLDIDKYNICNNIIQNFIGFVGISQYLFMYLFYQLPIWVYAYNYLTRRFAIYGVHYALKLGSVRKLLMNTVIRVMAYTAAYYIIGLGVLLLMDRTFIGKSLEQGLILSNSWHDAVLLPVNMILQTVVIISLNFVFWLKESGGKHFGFVIILILHIILSAVAGANEITPAWIPLTQGMYYPIRGNMIFALIYQLALAGAVYGIIYSVVIKEQSNIVAKKKEG